MKTKLDSAKKILYVRYRHSWTQKELGDRIGVGQWQASRWERGVEAPSRRRAGLIDDLCYETIEEGFHGFKYICNLGTEYGHRYEERADDALARLRDALLSDTPAAPVGRLNIIVLTSELPPGVRAQCFCSCELEPQTFFILVRDDASWRTNVRDEVFAHVLSAPRTKFDVAHE